MMYTKWALETPTREGYYWLYGDPHALKTEHGTEHVRLYIVKVSKIRNGYMYASGGTFIYPSNFVFPALWQMIRPHHHDPAKLWQDVVEALGIDTGGE